MGWVGIVAEKWIHSLVGPRAGWASLSVLISTGHTLLFFMYNDYTIPLSILINELFLTKTLRQNSKHLSPKHLEGVASDGFSSYNTQAEQRKYK